MKFIKKYNSIQDYLDNLYSESCSLPNISVVENTNYNNTLNSTYPHSLSFINNELKENYNIIYFGADNERLLNSITSILQDNLNIFGYSTSSTLIHRIIDRMGLNASSSLAWQCVVLNNGKVKNQLKDFNIGTAFIDAPLTAVVLPDTIETIGAGAFLECRDLSYVKLPNKLSKIPANMFGDCINLRNIDLPSTIKEIDYQAFYMSGINKIEIPSSCETFGNQAINSCPNLQLIKFKNPTYKRNKIKLCEYAFAGNTNLTTIEIPNCETLEISYSSFFHNPLQNILFYGNPNISILDDSGTGEDAIIPTTSYIYLPTNYKLTHNYDTLLSHCSSNSTDHINRIRHAVSPVADGFEGDSEGVFEFILDSGQQITHNAKNINYDIYYTIKNGYDNLLGKIVSNVKIHLGSFTYPMKANILSTNKEHTLSYTYNGIEGTYSFLQPPSSVGTYLQRFYIFNGATGYNFFYDGKVTDNEGVEYYQFRSSNTGINNSTCIATFEIVQPEIILEGNNIVFTPKIYSNAEGKYDYTTLSNINSTTVGFSTYGNKQGIWQNCRYSVGRNNYIDDRIHLTATYIKDGSQHSGTTVDGLLNDTGYIRFNTTEFTLMNENDTYRRIEIFNTVKQNGDPDPCGFTEIGIAIDSYDNRFNIYSSSNQDILHCNSILKITVEGTTNFRFKYAKTGSNNSNYFVITKPDIDINIINLNNINIYDETLIYHCDPSVNFEGLTENNYINEIDQFVNLDVVLPNTLKHTFYIIYVQNSGYEMSHGYIAFEKKSNYDYITNLIYCSAPEHATNPI